MERSRKNKDFSIAVWKPKDVLEKKNHQPYHLALLQKKTVRGVVDFFILWHPLPIKDDWALNTDYFSVW